MRCIKRYTILGVIAITPLLLTGCNNNISGDSNRDIVARYVENNEENSENAEIYRKLAEIIVNRDSKSEIVDYETEAVKKEDLVDIERMDDFTPGKVKQTADTDNVQCDFALESGLYVAGRDIPTGQYRIGFETVNHGMYCIEIHNGNQIQPGSMSKEDNMYWFNCEFTDDLLFKVDKKAYFKEVVPGNKDSDYDMSDEYFEDMGESELLWLAAADKKPEISISDAKVIKNTGNNTYVMQYSGGMVYVMFNNTNNLNMSEPITFNGRIDGSVRVGQKNLACIKVTNQGD